METFFRKVKESGRESNPLSRYSIPFVRCGRTRQGIDALPEKEPSCKTTRAGSINYCRKDLHLRFRVISPVTWLVARFIPPGTDAPCEL